LLRTGNMILVILIDNWIIESTSWLMFINLR